MKKPLLFLLLPLCFAAFGEAAYVIYLKDGTRIVTQQKYAVKGSNAIFRTKLGALTSVPLVAIDVARSDKVNSQGLGDAELLEWIDSGPPTPTPRPTPNVTGLGHLRTEVVKVDPGVNRPTPTPSMAFRETKYRDEKVDKVFQHGIESYHLYLFRSSQGSRPEYLFVEIQVNGQPEVVRALQAVCTTYNLIAEDLGKSKEIGRIPERVEIQMLNESGKEAGVFRISAGDAAELATGKITAEAFFVKHVIF